MAEQVTNQASDLAVAQKSAETKSGKGKRGREKRKKSRKGSPISLYVRGLISAEAYFKATNQKASRGI